MSEEKKTQQAARWQSHSCMIHCEQKQCHYHREKNVIENHARIHFICERNFNKPDSISPALLLCTPSNAFESSSSTPFESPV